MKYVVTDFNHLLPKGYFFRIIGRLVYCPALYRGDTTGFNYRDITARRLTKRLCWIQNENLDEIEDWGDLAKPRIGRSR